MKFDQYFLNDAYTWYPMLDLMAQQLEGERWAFAGDVAAILYGYDSDMPVWTMPNPIVEILVEKRADLRQQRISLIDGLRAFGCEVNAQTLSFHHGMFGVAGTLRLVSRLGETERIEYPVIALDALLLCMGPDAVPAEVTAYSTSSKSADFAPYDFPTTQISLVKFQDGRVGKTTSCVDCLQPYYFHTHLVGSHGSLLDDKFHSTKLGALNKAKWSQLSCGLVDSGDVKDHPYESQFHAFFDALAAGKEMPLTSFWDAYKSHQLIFAADKSAKTGKPVKLA
jgi:hypothetical protein